MGGFSKFFIDRPVFALVIAIVIVLAGAISIPILPVESTPDITPPTVQVSASYPGADAQVVADTVAQPIETQVNGVEDMLYMTSKSSSAGSMNLTVTFEVGTDPDMAQVLTQNRVSIANPLLPQEVTRQGVTTRKQSTSMVMLVSIISPDGRFDELYLSNYVATRIKDELARVEGVGQVTVFGAKDFGMRIWIDPTLLISRGLTTDDILAALREQNVQVAAGKIGAPPNPEGLNFQYQVTTRGRLSQVSEFEQIVVRRGQRGQLVRLGDVARVELGAQSYDWYAQLDGVPAISLGIYQLPGSNSLAVKEGVLAAMALLEESFPEGMEFRVPFDTTDYITASIREVVVSLLMAIGLVILTVFVFLQDFRTTLVPAVTIPVSLVGTFAVMLLMGQSINNLTLFGLVLAIGIVVDDAIVVVENTMRLIDEEGLSAKEATAKAMDEVAGAVVATTLVLLAVFVPTAVMPGLTGRMYQPFAVTISVATVFSSINALTLSPALCGLLLRPSPTERGRFFTAFNRLFERTTEGYMGIVTALTRRLGVVLALFAALLVAAWFGLGALPGGFVPNEDQGYFIINVELPAAASLDRTREILDRVNQMTLATEGVETALTIGGYSMLDGVQGPNVGAVIVSLLPWDERGMGRTVRHILGELQPQLLAIREATAFGFPPPPIAGLGSASGFTMQLQDRGGVGLRNLERFARDLVAAGEASPIVTRVNQNLRTTVPQLYLDVDREKVKSLGIPLQTVFSTLQTNLGASYVNDFNLFGRTWRVMAQADDAYRSEPRDIERLEVRTGSGERVPLSTLVTVEKSVGPQTVIRHNMYPAATITGSPVPGFSEGQATDEIERLARQTMPASIGYEWSGVTQQQKAAGNLAPLMFGLALVLVFLFLAAQYESWSTPLSVLLSVPIAILGAALLTLLRGLDNNIYTQIGLVLLVGLASKNAILIVEFAKQQREQEGATPLQAVLTAARLRFRPILMTAFSFILGVLPLVFPTGAGAASRVALGTAVFGGMLLATLVGVFSIPLLDLSIQGGLHGGHPGTTPADSENS